MRVIPLPPWWAATFLVALAFIQAVTVSWWFLPIDGALWTLTWIGTNLYLEWRYRDEED